LQDALPRRWGFGGTVARLKRKRQGRTFIDSLDLPALNDDITAKMFSPDVGIDCLQVANSNVAGTACQGHKVGGSVSFATFTPYTFKKPDKSVTSGGKRKRRTSLHGGLLGEG